MSEGPFKAEDFKLLDDGHPFAPSAKAMAELANSFFQCEKGGKHEVFMKWMEKDREGEQVPFCSKCGKELILEARLK